MVSRREKVTENTVAASPTALGTRLASLAARLRSDVFLAVLDAFLATAAYLSILLVRFEGSVPPVYWQGFLRFLPFAVVAHLTAHWVWGLYGQMWLHASVLEARRIALAGLTSLGVLAVLVLPGARPVPASVVLLGALVTTAAVGCSRFQSRLFAFRRGRDRRDATRVVVVGAGESGAAILRELLRTPDARLRPVALVDDDPRKQGRALSGVPVVGGIDALGDVVARHSADQALLAIPSATSEVVHRVANAADAAGVSLRVLPSVTELVSGQVSVRDLRDLSIDDLLGRQQVDTDLEAVRGLLVGRRVMITGAGGSIGAEIARQVATCDPARLLLLDHDETHLHDVVASLAERPSGPACESLLADVRDAELITRVVGRHRPDVIFHAAAHKHVPVLERHPREAVMTNVLGTRNVVAAARQVDVERFVLISTDKAVRPSSVMGASKWLCEQVVLGAAPPGKPYCAVRFGNVLGSRGSVVPTFMRQIEAGGPVTVTDPRMTRFFMSIPEAVQLVLQAAVFSRGSDIFMLEMGEPVRILDLAERMIRLSGRQVGVDVPIRVVGVRSGEKLAEELTTPDEATEPTPHPAIVALHPPRLPATVLADELADLAEMAASFAEHAIAERLRRLASGTPGVIRLPDSLPVPGIDTTARIASAKEASAKEGVWDPLST